MRLNKKTGTHIEMFAGAEVEGDLTGWYTQCLEHGACVQHPTRRIATQWMADPTVWCERCAEIKRLGDASFECRQCLRPTLLADALDSEYADTCTPCSEEIRWVVFGGGDED